MEAAGWACSGARRVKVLGVYLGTGALMARNWEGVTDQLVGRLQKWKWLLSQVSYRGRVLIINNLVASSLWHGLMVL